MTHCFTSFHAIVDKFRGRAQCYSVDSRAAFVKRGVFPQAFHIFAQVAAFILDEACMKADNLEKV